MTNKKKKVPHKDREVRMVDVSTAEDLAKWITRICVVMSTPVISVKFTLEEPLELPTEIKLE